MTDKAAAPDKPLTQAEIDAKAKDELEKSNANSQIVQ